MFCTEFIQNKQCVVSWRKCQSRGFPLSVGSFGEYERRCSLPDRLTFLTSCDGFTDNQALNAEQSRLAQETNLLYSSIWDYNISVM